MMVVQREGSKVVVKQFALDRMAARLCPVCEKPKPKWNRRTDWRCCSVDCTGKYGEECLICWDWPDLRMRVIKRDSFKCVKCGEKPKKEISLGLGQKKWVEEEYKVLEWVRKEKHGTMRDIAIVDSPEHGDLVADHIVPIALGGPEWDPDNIQTLCLVCNKVKTKKDQGLIGKRRRYEKRVAVGQQHLVKPDVAAME